MSKTLKIIAIIFFALTASMNLLGGIGTTCAAFIDKFSSTLGVLEYQWLYQIFVITTVLIGIAGIWATVKLAKGGKEVFRNALIILVIGTLVGGIHYYASMQIRGAAAPANVKFYLNVFTLVLFLILSIPGLKEKVDFSKGGGTSEKSGGGMAAILSGLMTLSVFYWAAPSHTYQGVNWVELLDISLFVLGFGFLAVGFGLIASASQVIIKQWKSEKVSVEVS